MIIFSIPQSLDPSWQQKAKYPIIRTWTCQNLNLIKNQNCTTCGSESIIAVVVDDDT